MDALQSTPGPWAWFGHAKRKEVYLATERHGRLLVMQPRQGSSRISCGQPYFRVGGLMKPASDLAILEADYRDDIAAVNHPDARLIAAAPDGLQLATEIVEYFGTDELDPLLTSDIRLRDLARQIIAKVEGGAR